MIMKRNLAIALLVVLFSQTVLAQELTNAEKRRINLKVLNTIEQYERTSALSDEDEVYMFRELFPSDSTYLPLDLMGVRNYMSSVTVKEYMDIVAATTFGLDISIYDVKKGNMTFDGGVWKVPIRFKKDMSYIDNNSVLFSSEEFYEGTKYDVTMTLEYDPAEDVCHIVSLEQTIDSRNQFPTERFYILNKSDDLSKRENRFETKMFKHNKLEYNGFDQVFVDQNELKPWHQDVKIKYIPTTTADNYDVVKLKYNKLKWRAKLRYAQTFNKPLVALSSGGIFEITTQDAYVNSVSSAREIGVDFWRAALTGKKGTALCFYTGIALSTSRVGLSADSFSYAYNTMDASGKSYKREYVIDSVTEEIEYTDYMIPVYVTIDHNFIGKWVQMSWMLGGKLYINKDVEASPMTVAGYINKQDFTASYSEFLAPTSYGKALSYSLMGGISFNVRACRYVYPYFKVNYELGIGKYHKATQYDFCSDTNYPFVYSAQTNDEIAVKSLLSCVDFYRKALWWEAGVMFKF